MTGGFLTLNALMHCNQKEQGELWGRGNGTINVDFGGTVKISEEQHLGHR